MRSLKFDPELFYVGAMFHDLGILPKYSSSSDRFEVDGAYAARDFLLRHRIAQQDLNDVWAAIALHTTPGVPQYMHPIVALITAGMDRDVLGIGLSDLDDATRDEVLEHFPPHRALQ